MEIPPHLQDRTNDLLLELESELGKDAANQFILIRSAIYYGDNGLPGIDPQVVMGPGSPNGDAGCGYATKIDWISHVITHEVGRTSNFLRTVVGDGLNFVGDRYNVLRIYTLPNTTGQPHSMPASYLSLITVERQRRWI
jgi:hypothetical protein